MDPALREIYVLLMVTLLKDVLSSASTTNGAQFVMISGIFVMLEWHVVSLGLLMQYVQLDLLHLVLVLVPFILII